MVVKVGCKFAYRPVELRTGSMSLLVDHLTIHPFPSPGQHWILNCTPTGYNKNNLPVMEYATTIEREEESGTTIESEDDKDEDISARNLWRRVIFNGIDSTIMLINCAIIYLRTSSANAIEGNWGLFIMMAAYLFHLTRKLIHVVQRSLFPNEYNVVMPTSVYSWMALMEFVILLVFLLI
ncbi:Hypothetical predicted protein [Olea europaea subsp. europaea]|uniref:Uncharacterized protein n=1 Tax=Olea europaea subsp. europaea TaxID=158383 RepID=A0A8S0QW91_OLEEU|nr:Hypothetical predicted protein [Olea europaea subsp. europaea]